MPNLSGVLSSTAHGFSTAREEVNDSPFDPNVMEDADHIPDICEGMDSKVTSRFGKRPGINGGFHYGTDYQALTPQPVNLQADGVVEYVNFGKAFEKHHWGNHIWVDHGGGVKTLHAHLSKSFVVRGTPIFRGQVIALTGDTGMYFDKTSMVMKRVIAHYHYAIKTTGFNRATGGFTNPQSFDWYYHQKYGVPYFPKMW